MSKTSSAINELLCLATDGDAEALGELFTHYRDRLKRMVHLRLDRRLHRRIDPSDVIQEAFLDASRRLPEYAAEPKIELFLWMRMITGQRLIDIHRHHLGAKMRDASQEVSLNQATMPSADLTSVCAALAGGLTTASTAGQRAELQALLERALNDMECMDREILVMRHFEMFTNVECAQLLDISTTAASNRYIRALKRIKKTIDDVPGLSDYCDGN